MITTAQIFGLKVYQETVVTVSKIWFYFT